ncbi:alpha/beta hydrolase [Flavobacterium sp.]|uniref:alpha/beta fold hydrolase n=1 Tax=Flavobacterium sp. TaxID=239 RepID=UPI002635259F|nr:alpha/beta hydrolase [Flavobacterium sp.]
MLFGILFLYVLFCQSCMTMRLSSKETHKYFDTLKIPFVSKSLKVDAHEIHYLQTGNADKPTLFFVHGSPGSWDAYKSYLSDTLLLKKYRMIAMDRPGFGYSNFGEAEDLPTQAQILEKFITQIDNHQQIVLVGHSLGGPVIVKMATDNPVLFQHLVILAGAVDPRAEKPERWRGVIMSKPLRYLIPGTLRTANDELWWLKSDLVAMEPDLKKITADVVIIHGTQDPLVPYRNMAFMNKAFVKAKSIRNISIENANHFIPWEHFDLIRDALLDLKI